MRINRSIIFSRRLATTFFFGFIATCVVVNGGQFNRVLSIGDAAPDWNNLPAIDGNQYSLSDFDETPLVALFFKSNSCPYAIDVEKRVVELQRKFKDSIVFVAVNSNHGESESRSAMKQKAAEAGFTFPYLHDKSQDIAQRYGATTTPEFFLLARPTNGGRKLVYTGSLDDSPDGKNISKHYLKDAINKALVNEPIEKAETVPIGCRIRIFRKR